MIDRSFKICNNWNSFHNDIENIKSNLIKNVYPSFLIDKVMKKYLHYKFSSNENYLKGKSDVHYFKLPYIGSLQINFRNFAKSFMKRNLMLSQFLFHSKLKIFPYKDPIPNDLKSFLVYKLTCASCSSSYIGETCCHFKTGIEEHIKKRSKSHIFKHLYSSATYSSPCSFLPLFFFCFVFLHFFFIYCFHYPYANYRYLLLS